MRMWYDETDEIVMDNWGKPIIEIADMVNDCLEKIRAEKGHWGSMWCGLGSVAYRAFDLGIIDEQEAKKLTRSARKRDVISVDVRERVIERDGSKCLKCGRGDSLQIDHILPVRFGGKNNYDNLQTLCKSCNTAKGIEAIDYRKSMESASYRIKMAQAIIGNVGRNDRCPCGSGKRYKSCCMKIVANKQNSYQDLR